jgi:hypothetical protein
MKTAHAVIIGVSIIIGFAILSVNIRSMTGQQESAGGGWEATTMEAGRYEISVGSPDAHGACLIYLLDTTNGRRWRRVDTGGNRSLVNGKLVWEWEETTPAGFPEK